MIQYTLLLLLYATFANSVYPRVYTTAYTNQLFQNKFYVYITA